MRWMLNDWKERFPRVRSSNGPSGIVLVLVLWMLVTLAVLSVAMVRDVRVDNAIRLAGADRVRVRWLARGGIYQAISVVVGDRNETDSVDDRWYEDEALFKRSELAGGVVRVYGDRLGETEPVYGVVDHASRVNLNTADFESLMGLPMMTADLAEAIIAFRERLESGVGDELGGPIDSMSDLSLIDGMTPEVLYGEDVNFNGLLDANEDDGEESQPSDNGDGVLQRGLLHYVTVYSYERNEDGAGIARVNINTVGLDGLVGELGLTAGQAKWVLLNRGEGYLGIADLLDEEVASDAAEAEADLFERIDMATFRRIADHVTVVEREKIYGRININTAQVEVLQTLPGVTVQLAGGIVQYRSGLAGGYSSIAELLVVPGVSVELFKRFAELITVRSHVFGIRAIARAQRTGLTHRIHAVIDRGGVRPVVLYWREDY